jgi:predicted RNA-binding Zn-ribbon protein involved in translation (DUF1610 family)
MQTKIVYLGYHFNSVDGQHVNRIIETIKEVKSFINARASEMYSADVEDLVKSIPAMTVGQCKYLDIDHGDWVTVTCVETPSENNSELDFDSVWLPSVQIGKKDVDSAKKQASAAFSLKDGSNIKNIHVAYNGPEENDTILIWEENTFGGASDAPIAIVNNGGKLEIRYWQPEDMGCDPTSVVAIKPYGIYDIQLESGVELDEFDMSIIKNDCQTVATAKMDEDGTTYDVKAHVVRTSDGGFGYDIFRHGKLLVSSDVYAEYWSVRDCFFALLNKEIEQPDLKIIGTIEEGCPHCDATVELKDEFHAQACPECGEMILPCNICPHMDCDNYDPEMCNACPIEHTKISNQKEEV